jgi:hypothetical protein
MRSRTLVGGVQRRYWLRLPRTAHRLLGPRSVRAPGNHQSAGKRISVSIRHGNKWLGATLVEAAQYHRLAALGDMDTGPPTDSATTVATIDANGRTQAVMDQ